MIFFCYWEQNIIGEFFFKHCAFRETCIKTQNGRKFQRGQKKKIKRFFYNFSFQLPRFDCTSVNFLMDQWKKKNGSLTLRKKEGKTIVKEKQREEGGLGEQGCFIASLWMAGRRGAGAGGAAAWVAAPTDSQSQMLVKAFLVNYKCNTSRRYAPLLCWCVSPPFTILRKLQSHNIFEIFGFARCVPPFGSEWFDRRARHSTEVHLRLIYPRPYVVNNFM